MMTQEIKTKPSTPGKAFYFLGHLGTPILFSEIMLTYGYLFITLYNMSRNGGRSVGFCFLVKNWLFTKIWKWAVKT